MSKYSKIPLTQHAQHQTVARLLDILDYQIVPIEVILLLLLYLDYTTNQGSIPFEYLLQLLFL